LRRRNRKLVSPKSKGVLRDRAGHRSIGALSGGRSSPRRWGEAGARGHNRSAFAEQK
jgi:hypothetical protein